MTRQQRSRREWPDPPMPDCSCRLDCDTIDVATSGSPGKIRSSGRAGLVLIRAALTLVTILCLVGRAVADDGNSTLGFNSTDPNRPIPLKITNLCSDTLWPGISTGHGIGPGTGGFELVAGNTTQLWVSSTWQGRIWGRTNCSFNANGTGPSNKTGINGYGSSCLTGDCWGVLNCSSTGAVPATLAEFLFRGGVNGDQDFYDLSLVDGYNIPVGLQYLPALNTSFIPPNLVNPACVATAGWLPEPVREGYTYTNKTYPMPYESAQTNEGVGHWCPWDLQTNPPSKPGDGVYPYPDDGIPRPVFDPCLSACSATGSAADCCTGKYNEASKCSPSLYSHHAKAVCPDAYSYAFDDQTSTFIIPSGGGWEIIFCPATRSTDILATFGSQLSELAATGNVSAQILADVTNVTYIETHGASSRVRGSGRTLAFLVLGWAVLQIVW